MTKRYKLAIIGASSGQLPLVRKAKEMGIYSICFAWDKGAVCKDECDEFYPISIYDIDEIVNVCRNIGVNGVVSTASEETAMVVSEVAYRLNLNCNTPDIMRRIQNKGLVRIMTQNITGLSKPTVWSSSDTEDIKYPCVVKPVKGSAKRGVTFCRTADHLQEAIRYAASTNQDVIVEEFIEGDEFAIESLSYHGIHQVVQITRKVNTGIPHFVEMELHQSPELWNLLHLDITKIIPQILDSIGFTNGASHIEIKINNGKFYLIEINPRGAGDRTDTLIPISTNCDFIGEMIKIALDCFKEISIAHNAYSGILFLSSQNNRILKYFNDVDYDWLYERKLWTKGTALTESTSNYERDGYIIYKSSKPLTL